MTARHSSPAKLPVSEELVITRVLDAPLEDVWQALTDSTRFMVRTIGPRSFIARSFQRRSLSTRIILRTRRGTWFLRRTTLCRGTGRRKYW
jgi:hypothetical protein